MKKEHLIDYWLSEGIVTDKRIIDVFRELDREDFILEDYRDDAYEDSPLPILSGQTISQPTTIMMMTQALELKEGDHVLEVGAGSGYQAAIIAKLVEPGKVITTEIIPELADFAKNNLKKAGIKNVHIIKWDGGKGYSKEAPYDKIIVTAACPEVPKILIAQLKNNGILLAPVGDLSTQRMLKIRKKGRKISKENLGFFRFVPLTGEHGFK